MIDIDNNDIHLGAMNLDYMKVKQVIKKIEKEFELNVILKQITSLEWETWFENTHSVSVESLQKNSLLKSIPENDIPIQKELNNIQDSLLLEKDNQNLENEIDLLRDNFENENDELIDDANDEALIRLAQANIGDDSDIENDILFGEELTASSDPVISGVASILSKCFTLKGSDIHAEPRKID